MHVGLSCKMVKDIKYRVKTCLNSFAFKSIVIRFKKDMYSLYLRRGRIIWYCANIGCSINLWRMIAMNFEFVRSYQYRKDLVSFGTCGFKRRLTQRGSCLNVPPSAFFILNRNIFKQKKKIISVCH